ncbi:hypothetical protein N177_0100 [Lutibaculum baratangense AMV1]|uniref:L,D-TPase catalytic domain-containing protein n=2 Tax=Lutibaculum TaxID=1358438 RepID=V4RN45_9HYPH|nr:hypothetical protein N177_0100 [Lutibaculum baratangense AMV1]
MFLGGALAFAAAAAACTPQQGGLTSYAGLDPRFARRQVDYAGKEKPGTIVVDTSERYLYFVEPGGKATRYGIGVGREGAAWAGTAYVGRKEEWPRWTPTANMIARDSRLLQYAGGVEGGEHNPLGARALYLYRGGRDTMYRLHGTNAPWSIGQASSSGCIRLLNEDVMHLYERVPMGSRVIVRR